MTQDIPRQRQLHIVKNLLSDDDKSLQARVEITDLKTLGIQLKHSPLLSFVQTGHNTKEFERLINMSDDNAKTEVS